MEKAIMAATQWVQNFQFRCHVQITQLTSYINSPRISHSQIRSHKYVYKFEVTNMDSCVPMLTIQICEWLISVVTDKPQTTAWQWTTIFQEKMIYDRNSVMFRTCKGPSNFLGCNKFDGICFSRKFEFMTWIHWTCDVRRNKFKWLTK